MRPRLSLYMAVVHGCRTWLLYEVVVGDLLCMNIYVPCCQMKLVESIYSHKVNRKDSERDTDQPNQVSSNGNIDYIEHLVQNVFPNRLALRCVQAWRCTRSRVCSRLY